MADVFVYGTLMDEALVRTLTGKRFAREPAVLADFARFTPPGGYPYVLPHPGGRVEGFLLRHVDETALAVLDEYEEEGRLYRRQEVVVHLDTRDQRCFVYVADCPAIPDPV